MIAFALQLRNTGLTTNVPWFWQSFNVGLPVILWTLFKIFPSLDPSSLARLATVLVNGLQPLLPFFFWRGVLPYRVRILAGAALALWPGQILFTAVVAQDNWVLFPSIGLAALAVRAVCDEKRAWPVTAGLMYTAAVAMRADMLVLLPLLLAAVRVDRWRTRSRQIVAGALAAACGLIGLGWYRYAASGRFSLAPAFGGLAILGSYLPGSSISGWEPPYAYLAWSRPELLRDRNAMIAQTAGLGIHEALRRPAFHAARIASMMGSFAVNGDAANLYWSLEAPEVLPAAVHERAAALAAWWKEPLPTEMCTIQALFFATMLIGMQRKNRPILVLSAAVLLKYFFHAFGVFQARYFVAATGLEVLTIALGIEELVHAAHFSRKWLVGPLSAGAAFSLALLLASPPLLASVQRRDIDRQQHTYHFFLETPEQLEPPDRFVETWPVDRDTQLNCTVDQGGLVALSPGVSATIGTLQRDPAPGEKAIAVCQLTGTGAPKPLTLEVLDAYAPGGMDGRIVQRVAIDGVEVFCHDIAAEPWSGWTDIPLGKVGAGTNQRVVIEVDAIRPDPGMAWGDRGRTTFQIVSAPPSSDLALRKPATQSSTLPGYATTVAMAAVDGNKGGNFFDGSVTSTNREAKPWWQVDLLTSSAIGSIVIWNRTDCCHSRLSDYWVFVSDSPFHPEDTPATLQKRPATWSSHQIAAPDPSSTIQVGGARGRYVRVQLSGTDYLSLAEVEVFGQ